MLERTLPATNPAARLSQAAVVARAVALAALVALATGCSGDHAIAPVAGRVTLNGAPLAGAAVTFQPVTKDKAENVASGSYGHTDADGRFTLRLVSNDRPGAMVGMHAVTISLGQGPASGDALPAPSHKVPAALRNGSERFEVPSGGTQEANFDLKSH